MIETATRYNDYTEPRNHGVTRTYRDARSHTKALSYSSAGHTVTYYTNNRRVDSHRFENLDAARAYFRCMQRLIENVDGYRRIN